MNQTTQQASPIDIQIIKVGQHSPQITTNPSGVSSLKDSNHVENIVQRLRRRINDAKSLGCEVRLEWLDDSQGDWCVVGGKRTIFLDSGQTAAEQLTQLEEILHEIFPTLLPRS